MSNILIAGCGYVGTQLAIGLRDAGHTVWCIRRTIEKLPQGVEPLQGDLSHAETIPPLPAELDHVVYSAGAGGFEEAKYRAAYVEGPKNVLSALEKAGAKPKRIVFTSSTGVYHQTDGKWVDETSPTEPQSFSGSTLLEGERLILAASVKTQPPSTSPSTGEDRGGGESNHAVLSEASEGHYQGYAIRFGGIYGPGRDRLIRSVREGTASMPKEASYLNLIHRDDCAGAIQHLLFANSAPGIYNGVDNQPVDRRELYAWIAEQLGVNPPPTSNKPDATTRQSRSNKRCKNEKIKESGFANKYPTYCEGLMTLI